MSDRSPYSEIDDDTDGRRIPRWAWVIGIVAAVVLLGVVVLMLTGGGGHPRPDHGGGEDAPPSRLTEQLPEGHEPPEGMH